MKSGIGRLTCATTADTLWQIVNVREVYTDQSIATDTIIAFFLCSVVTSKTGKFSHGRWHKGTLWGALVHAVKGLCRCLGVSV